MNENNFNESQQFNYDIQQNNQVPAPQKVKKPIYKKWWFWVIIVIFLLAVISSAGGDDEAESKNSDTTNSTSVSETTTEETTIETTTELPSMSIEELEESSKEIPYKDLARDPDNYTGELVKFSGEVVQVIESSFGANQYRIAVTKDEYGYYDYNDIVYLTYSLKDGESRILEDDIVTFYGTYTGLTSYASTLGGKITIPAVEGEYVEINN